MKKQFFVVIFFILAVSFLCAYQIPKIAYAAPDTPPVPGYRLPFVGGDKKITQGPYCPGTSHTNSEAIDFSMASGTSLYAPASGEIIYANFGWNDGYGNLMKIEHSDGSVTYLAHLSGFERTSGYVSANELVAYSGNSGMSTNPHLHLEIRKDGGYINLRSLDGITWTSGDPNQPCAPSGTMDGHSYGPPLNNGVALYAMDNYLGSPVSVTSPTQSPIEFSLMPAGSIQIVTGWSAKLYPDVFLGGQCITQSYPDLDFVYIYSFLGIRAIEVYDNPTCSPPPPFDPICTLQMRNGEMIDSIGGCDDPTPTPGGTPTPGPSPTPTPPPPPQTGNWSVKVFSFLNECNDSPNCSPTSTYFQTSISGTNFNLNFADGKAFGVGGDQWGAFFQQTINFSPGTYYFHADHDDGVKIWVNGWISCEYMYLSISLEFSNI